MEFLKKLSERLRIAGVVAELQAAMLKRRLYAGRERFRNAVGEKYRSERDRAVLEYMKLREMWAKNHYFTFWFISGNGQNIAKKNVEKRHLKYAFTGAASVLAGVVLTIGILAHFAHLNFLQKQELEEYKNTRAANEQKIKELEKIAESNQQQLAYLSKLEDQVRMQLEKNGSSLPPKSTLNAAGGMGGPVENFSPITMVMEKEMSISSEAEVRRQDLEKLLTVIKNDNHRRESTPNIWPTVGGELTSRFGGRRNPFDGYSSDWHPGIDIANDYGAPIYAGASGYVEQSGWFGGYGRYVKINHDYGYQTAYGHMSSIAVREGEYVKKGQLVGTVGSSGYSTGPHLHYEVLLNGEQVDPLQLM